MSDSVVWGYAGAIGPSCWGGLRSEFSLCDCGKEQSPIDLAQPERLPLSPIEFDYRQVRAGVGDVIDTGTTLQLNCASGGGIRIDGIRYDLVQLHFHHGSEHLIDGRRLAMELHLVHRSKEGDICVIGVLLEEGAHNHAFDPIWRHLRKGKESDGIGVDESPATVDPASLLPVRRSTWRYRGSLTTPPCKEGVRWLVMTEPSSLSSAQIAAYGAVYPDSHRPVQPLGERILACDA
ncbi:carbonic anhydrase [Thioalkalivibrio sp. HK1]|uniref:carbonic anhydrase n=1 Tax=Thioalkalivibrio sp. HK1 TaxID=1469245 RepID=UPI0004728CEC|nr:carbonic anhydrase family protein [Thioalkalivibrio sp. HK1]